MPEARAASPAARQASLGRDVVESVLLEVKGLRGRVDREAVVRALEGAIAALHALGGSGVGEADHLGVVDGARAAVREARETLGSRDVSDRALRMVARLAGVEQALGVAREATLEAVVAAQGDVIAAEARGGQRRAPPPPEPFTASRGAPRVHALARAPMTADVDVMAPTDFVFDEIPASSRAATADLAEDRAGPFPEGLVADLGPPGADDLAADDGEVVERLAVLGQPPPGGREDEALAAGLEAELAQLERLGRDCLEEIGGIATLRRLKEDERYRWAALERFEQRMLSALDALLALGEPFYLASGHGARCAGLDVLDLTRRWSRDGPTVDAGRAFARAFVLGCVAGEDTVRAAVLALRQSHPATHEAQAHALGLAPNEAVVPAMVRLLEEGEPRFMALALDVLHERGGVDVGAVLPLLEHAHASVRARAARALGIVAERDVVVEQLGLLLETETDDDVVLAAAEALAFQGASDGVDLARERLVEELDEPGMVRLDVRARLMQLLGVAGDAEDGELLARLYVGQPEEALGLGFHGHVGHVDTLLEALRPGGNVVAGPVGRKAAAAALARITGAPLFAAAPPAPPDPYDLRTYHAEWKAWWDEHRERFDGTVRYRFGEPMSGLHDVSELERDAVPMHVRRLCALELGLILRAKPTNVHGLAVRQAEAIAKQRAALEAALTAGEARSAAGRWLLLA
jgi:hypothetical protein